MFEIDTDSKTCFNPFYVMLNNHFVSIHTQLCTKMNLQDLSQDKSITPGQLASLQKGNGQIITVQHITQLWKTPYGGEAKTQALYCGIQGHPESGHSLLSPYPQLSVT